jgi:uncharacterized protein (TIGR02271 family)
MYQTLVGVFDDQAEAMRARAELVESGFSSDAIRIQSEDSDALSGEPTSESSTGDPGYRGDSGVLGFFKSLFGFERSDADIGTYREAIRRGSCVLSVEAQDIAQARLAEEILQRYQTVDLNARAAEWSAAGWTGADAVSTSAAGSDAGFAARDAGTPSDERVAGDAGSAAIPVVQEALQVGKRRVDKGGIRVYTHVTEKPVEETVQLQQEHARIERRAVDRPATEADFAAMKDETIEVHETAEEPVVAKQARVVEEVRVGKQVEQRSQTVRDTVRRTDVQVENLDTEHATAAAGSKPATERDRLGGASGSRERASTPAERAAGKARSSKE